MKRYTIPLYNDIFIDEDIPSKEDLLKQTPTDAIIRKCCAINAHLQDIKDTNEKEKRERVIFEDLVNDGQNPPDENKYYKNLDNYICQNKKHSINIFPLITSLRLIEESLFCYTPGDVPTITYEQKLNILKLLLLYNIEESNRLENNIKKIVEDGEDKMYQFFWPNLLPISTFVLDRIFLFPIYKAIHFLEYLEVIYPVYFKNYLSNNAENSAQRTFKIFEFFYKSSISKDYLPIIKGGLIGSNDVVNEFIMDINEFSKTDKKKNYSINIKEIRNRPLIKYENGDWGITNWNFIVEKIYDGLIFDFHKNSGITATVPKFEDLKSELGKNFSEKFFMDTMKAIFSREGIVALKEVERNNDCNYDFYIRIRNQVFLFEFKDTLFRLDDEYLKIKTFLNDRLLSDNHTNEKQSKKKTGQGVIELVQQIEKLANKPETFDDFGEYSNERLFIYPILVYTDISFGIQSIEHYINYGGSGFYKKLPKEVKEKFFLVNPIAMIHFDFFLKHYDSFKKGEMDLVKVIHSYQQTKLLNRELYEKNKTPDGYIGLYDSFNTIADRRYFLDGQQFLKGSVYEFITNKFEPYWATKSENSKSIN